MRVSDFIYITFTLIQLIPFLPSLSTVNIEEKFDCLPASGIYVLKKRTRSGGAIFMSQFENPDELTIYVSL